MKLHHVGLFLLSCTCLLPCAATTARAGISREAEALVNWKASLAGAHESLGSWSLANSASLCNWTFITCDSARHISELQLDGISLDGTLDQFDFLAFPHLKKVFLVDNGLYGTVPAKMGNLTSLVVLQIIGSPYLQGAIPRSIFQLKHLTVLQLIGLGLNSTLPEEIGNLTSLQELSLSSVILTGSIPITIGILTKLRSLQLGNNNLTGSIPLEIGNMTELQGLYFRTNCLEGQLPGTISHLVKLQYLDLSENHLRGHIVPELGNSSLLGVDIQMNNFSGLFPSSICVGGALQYLLVAYNGFTGIQPQTFQNCTALQDMDFTANNIATDLRNCFPKHSGQLHPMAFGENKLYGTLLGDLFLCNYTYLEVIDLSNNCLHGVLSKCFWDTPSLIFMDLSSNSFSGVVPFSRTFQEEPEVPLAAET